MLWIAVARHNIVSIIKAPYKFYGKMLQYVAADWSLRPHTDRNPGVVVTPQACHGGACGFIQGI